MDALIVVDIQNDFLPGGALAVPRGDEVVPVANRGRWLCGPVCEAPRVLNEATRNVAGGPDPGMSVEQHRIYSSRWPGPLRSQLPGTGSNGASYPRTEPFIEPTKPVEAARSTGTSLATGRPCRVTTYSARDSRTWSTSSRHRALNSAEPTSPRGAVLGVLAMTTLL